MLEREAILVGRKIKVAICSLEVDLLPLSEGWLPGGFLLKFISSQPKQETITSIYSDNLCMWQAGCVVELRTCASSIGVKSISAEITFHHHCCRIGR